MSNPDICAGCAWPFSPNSYRSWLGEKAYHVSCLPRPATPKPDGAKEVRHLTEADVRRIVREEIAAASIGEKK